jgi:hypothetical protein
LLDFNTLKNLPNFLVDFQDNLEVGVHGLVAATNLGGALYFSRTFSRRS